MTQKITLQAWAEARFSPPPSVKTLQRWARDAWIRPAPKRAGKRYYVDLDAEFVGRDEKKPEPVARAKLTVVRR